MSTFTRFLLLKSRVLILGLAAAILSLTPEILLAQSLKTPNHRVVLQRNCPEGNVVCNNVSYYGINFRTGASIRLKGRTVHALCQDQVTPCRFLGYEFFNGDTRYFVREDGELTVTQGRRLILREKGTWMPNNR